MTADGLPDDRITCATCTQFGEEHRWCKLLQIRTTPAHPFRCMGYTPIYGEPDRRTGAERWPTLKATIEEVRAIDDAAAAKFQGRR